MSLRRWIPAFALPLIFAASCAGAPERPVVELTRAKTLVDQAEKTGAPRFAAAELERARNKVAAAESAASNGEQETARRLATEAALDAEYAAALASAVEAKRSEEEIRKSVEALRDEAARRPDGSTDRP
ncbi:MAG TPA: DUF4398 domain-containing protein [Steroidobacteraceae bacterium]|nr:DUF4398 domain-containing protein [Steroidobacteraceae bacterium]